MRLQPFGRSANFDPPDGQRRPLTNVAFVAGVIRAGGLDTAKNRYDNEEERFCMPQQQMFFEQQSGDSRIEVLKTYDISYAREAFEQMDETAHSMLWTSLGIDQAYDSEDVPLGKHPERDDFLWEELLDVAREDGNLLSFFVVNQIKGMNSESLYVSPDWPSAKAFAKKRFGEPL